MRSRTASLVSASTTSASTHRVWSLEGMLLMTGLATVFVLGVMLSSHVHIMDPPHGPVTYERQLHSLDGPHLKSSWVEDYIQSREALMRLLAAGNNGNIVPGSPEEEAATGEYQTLSLRDLIKKVMGHGVDGLDIGNESPEEGKTPPRVVVGVVPERLIHSSLYDGLAANAFNVLVAMMQKTSGPQWRKGQNTHHMVLLLQAREAQTFDDASISAVRLRGGPERIRKQAVLLDKERPAAAPPRLRAAGSSKADDTSSAPAAAAMVAQLPQWKRNLQSIPLLIICHNRPEYLDRTLSAVFKHHPGDGLVPILISEDGRHANMAKTVEKYRALFKAKYPNVVFVHVHHSQDPSSPSGYHKLAQHYKWALSQAFDHLNEHDSSITTRVDNVIILEEDLEVAPDFFNFFGSLAPLLESDKTLMAISAWNDNGMGDRVRDPTALYRSDFFPGLGWMMPRRLWGELEPKWPKGYWDDWLREPKQRQDRQVIRPEVCRTFHFGMQGTSNAEYSDYLSAIRLNDRYVAFDAMDLATLLEPANYERDFMASVNNALDVSVKDLLDGQNLPQAVRVTYGTLSDGPNSFEALAHHVGVMDNIKARVPRTAYQGIVTCWRGNTKVYMVPSKKMYR